MQRLDEEPVEDQEGCDGGEGGGTPAEGDGGSEHRQEVQHRHVGQAVWTDDEADDETDERYRYEGGDVALEGVPGSWRAPPPPDGHYGVSITHTRKRSRRGSGGGSRGPPAASRCSARSSLRAPSRGDPPRTSCRR